MSSPHALPFDPIAPDSLETDSYIESDTDTAVAPSERIVTPPRGRGAFRALGRGRGVRGRGRGRVFQEANGPPPSLEDQNEDAERVRQRDRGSSPPRRKLKNRPKRVFGITRSKADAAVPGNYEHLYPEDEFGEEMGPEARVWRVYLDEAHLNDADMIDGWKDGVDVLLVFAGLFSAVVTTLVIQTSQKLDNNFSEISAYLLTELVALQRAAASGGSANDVPPAQLTLGSRPNYSQIDLWINGLWFTSLALSLVTALAATLVKQWIQYYVSLPSGTPQERVRVHQFRYMGLQRWTVPMIMGVLPLFIHAALFLFFVGLIAFLSTLDAGLAWAVCAVGSISWVSYLITILIPLWDPQCPYRTPLVAHGHIVGSHIASIVYDSYKYVTHRIAPRLLAYLSGEKLRHGRLGSWCTSRLATKVPRYEILSLKEIEIRAAKRAGISTDIDAIRWLLDSSSNYSVRDIALQAFSGIYDIQQKERVRGSSLEDDLKNAVRSRFQLVVSRYYRDEDPVPLAREFTDSDLFMGLERLLRASTLVLNFRVFSSRNVSKIITALLRSAWEEIDEQRLVAFTAYAFLTCDATGQDVSLSLSNDELVQLAKSSFLMSEINQHQASRYPLLWGGYFTVLQRSAQIFYDSVSSEGLLNTYYRLVPLLDTLTLSELSRPGLAVPSNPEHLFVVRSMTRFAYMVIGNSLTKTTGLTVPVPLHDKGRYDFRFLDGCTIPLQFWVILMKLLITACKESDPYRFRFALCAHLGRLSLFCHRFPFLPIVISKNDFTSILAVLDDLYHQPFLHETQWGPNTYMEFFFLYLKLEEHHDTGPTLITPLLDMTSSHISERNFVVGLFRAISRNMKSPSPNRLSKGSEGISGIAQVVKGLTNRLVHLHEIEDADTLALIFDVLLDLNWIEQTIKRISTLMHRDPPAWHWRPILPLINVLIEISLAYYHLPIEEDLSTDICRRAERIQQELVKPLTLETLCEVYICLPAPDLFPFKGIAVPGPEARVFLRLAEAWRHEGGWRSYINRLARAFTDFHGSKRFDRRKKKWSRTDYEQYRRVVEFVGDLKKVLHIRGEEYEMPWIEEDTLDSLGAENAVTDLDAIVPESSTAQKLFEPVMRNIMAEKQKEGAETSIV